MYQRYRFEDTILRGEGFVDEQMDVLFSAVRAGEVERANKVLDELQIAGPDVLAERIRRAGRP